MAYKKKSAFQQYKERTERKKRTEKAVKKIQKPSKKYKKKIQPKPKPILKPTLTPFGKKPKTTWEKYKINKEKKEWIYERLKKGY